MNTKFLGIMIGTIGMMSISGVALAYHGDYQTKGPNTTAEREAQMTQAMTTQNYTLWKSLMNGRGRASTVVTEQNFPKLTEAWKLGKAGNQVGADALRAELGLRTKNGAQGGIGLHQGSGRADGRGFGRAASR